MMQTTNYLNEKGVEIRTFFSDKYKSNSLSLCFELPMNDEAIANAHVLASVLLRGCKKYRTVKELERKLNMLYDPIVTVKAFKTSSALVFKVAVSYIDERFLPDCDNGEIFCEVTDIIYEILANAFPEDEALFEKYTEAEKKLRIDNIRAERNNKDSYAISRCQQIMFSGSPLGCNGKGTEKCVSEITPSSLKNALEYILCKAPVYIMYAGTEREKDLETLEAFAMKLFEYRKSSDIVKPIVERPSYENIPKEVTEQADAAQGREVLAFTTDDFTDSLCKSELFNEIFGASPVSRLFMNVRERLQLCYYCASGFLVQVSAMFVRCGIANENREKAINEIKAQLESLKAPDNITDFEFSSAKMTLRDYYMSLRDDMFSYVEWMYLRHIEGVSENVDDYLAAIDSYTKDDVSEVARSAKLKLDFFLEGTAGA